MVNVSNWRIKLEAQAVLSRMPRITSLGKEIHFQLVFHYNIETRLCYPSEETLAELVGKSTRSVRSALKHLEERGVISIRSRGARNGTNRYDLHVLERKVLELRPERNCANERKISAAKQRKENKKEKGAGDHQMSEPETNVAANASQQPQLVYELVTKPENIDAWDSLLGILNIGIPSKILEMTRCKDGYRLPSQVTDKETGHRLAARSFFVRVLTSKGRCFEEPCTDPLNKAEDP